LASISLPQLSPSIAAVLSKLTVSANAGGVAAITIASAIGRTWIMTASELANSPTVKA
jgi:hypothetical protein